MIEELLRLETLKTVSPLIFGRRKRRGQGAPGSDALEGLRKTFHISICCGASRMLPGGYKIRVSGNLWRDGSGLRRVQFRPPGAVGVRKSSRAERVSLA
ncbi:hypothetical protein [Caulobacter sp. LARHSG274]